MDHWGSEQVYEEGPSCSPTEEAPPCPPSLQSVGREDIWWGCSLGFPDPPPDLTLLYLESSLSVEEIQVWQTRSVSLLGKCPKFKCAEDPNSPMREAPDVQPHHAN